MIGMVLVTHGRLAEEFVNATEHVVGPQTQVRAISIGPDDDMEQRRQDILNAVAEVESGAGVIIAGINLPMLIKLASVRGDDNMPNAVASAQESGRKYINVASHLLASKS